MEVQRNPQSDAVSISDDASLTDITSSEDESNTNTSRVTRAFRTPRSTNLRRHPSPSPSPVRTMTRHRYLSHIKRCASAPCRVPLHRPFPRRKVSLEGSLEAAIEEGGGSDTDTSLPAPYAQGPNEYGAIPNPMDDEFEGSELEQAKHRALRARVDSWRKLKLNGTLVNYTQSRRGKSTIEKLYKSPASPAACLATSR